MINTLLGQKQQMDQVFIEWVRYQVTWVVAGPCVVTYVKKADQTDYWSVQLGFGEKRIKNTTKPMEGHLRGVIKNKKAPRFLREIKVFDDPGLKVGDVVSLKDVFEVGNVVVVTGVSKGKGFAGVVKRHGFAGGPKTHGQSDRWRAPGSIGQSATPGRVYKGKKMAGRMGSATVTVRKLKVVETADDHIVLKGTLPGGKKGLLEVRTSR